MLMNLKNLTKFSALTLVAGLAVGCASTSELEKVRTEAQQASATAAQADSKASEALNAAQQAQAAASDAKACCEANTERLNRMFKKSMYK